MLFIKSKAITFFISGILFISLCLAVFNFGAHPYFQNWKKEKVLITEVKTEKKAVSLTFDDGPDPINTPVVLDNLKKHNAKATFFVMGSRAEKYPDILKRIASEGHEIGNHSYSHVDFNHKDNKFLLNEIERTNAIIYQITRQKPSLFRPPGGYLSYALVELTKDKDITIAYWTYKQDSKDWRGVRANQIANHIIKNIEPGQIIILHDGTPNGLETAKAVDILVEKLSNDGYEFVTMSELIRIGNEE
ncbi:Putative polysaccharide deacetylase [Candidatus Syntrophocurvum alkaliphilum]|uniref:Polysaccharide deacetylase n=1 Tax=Candidatus Syntrophocurvum alkaliphilum TaxID=2293317 RepID=A0A6I6DK84_9FIRM|nr:polysaccharide deacetylase family protein [Candidatus Syntrophocurvum alkaliphilum]QGT99741.1 Putative polysaccharide deacetylase [Candidatus Syntrophocurvum alkaliphilum]